MYTTTCADLEGRGSGVRILLENLNFLIHIVKLPNIAPVSPPPPKTQISLGPPSPMEVFWIRACTKSIYNITSVKKSFLNTSNDRCDCENYKRNVIQIHVRQQRNLCWNITYIHVGKLLLFYNS